MALRRRDWLIALGFGAAVTGAALLSKSCDKKPGAGAPLDAHCNSNDDCASRACVSYQCSTLCVGDRDCSGGRRCRAATATLGSGKSVSVRACY